MPKKELLDLKTLASLDERVERFGDRSAVVRFTREGREDWAGSRLAGEARRLAGGLREEGIAAGEHVAVMAEPSPEWFVAALAILRVGAVLVPIDTQMSDADLGRVLEDCGARRVFATARVAGRFGKLGGESSLEVFLLDQGQEEAEAERREGNHRNWQNLRREEEAPAASVGDDDRAVLFYTSGTTGPPKGVPLTHRNIVYQIQAVAKTGLVKAEDRMLLPLPLHHVYPLVIGMLTPLALGVTILLPHALTGDGIVRALSEGEGTLILGVPRLYRALFEGIRAQVEGAGGMAAGLFAGGLALARAGRRVGLPVGNLLFRPVRKKMGPNVRLLASGGSPLDPELAENLEALGWPVAVGYGLTETSPLLTVKRPGEGDYTTAGKPIDGVELKIDPSVLPENEQALQREGRTEERGEVLARGPSVFHGYHHLPEKTEASLQDGWFRTGDLGYLDGNGFLHLGGRASSMIVLEGGENINPEDLEDFYSGAEEVAEVGILEENGKLAALAVPDRSVLRERGGEEVATIVRKGLERRGAELATYKRLSEVEITREPLPRTRLGKIRRHVLAERFAGVKRGEESGRRATGPVPVEELSSEDRSLLEDTQARKIWDLLAKRYAGHRLTPDASLAMDLGIDSLEWVELSLSAQERAGVSITEDVIERSETVRDLLEAAASAGAEELGEGKRPIEHPEEVLSESDRRWAEPVGPGLSAVRGVVYGFLRGLAAIRGCRFEARGRENLPEEGPFIVVPNHVSFLDAPALTVAFGRGRLGDFFWAGHGDVMFRNQFRRWVSRLFQVVPIDPRRGPLSSLAAGALVVKWGHPLVWFAEGRVSRDGKLQPFQPGVGLIAAHYEPPVIPVFIDGTYEAMPLGRKFPRSGRVVVYFGKPIEGKELRLRAERLEGGGIHQRMVQVLHAEVAKLRDSVRGGPREREEPGRRAA